MSYARTAVTRMTLDMSRPDLQRSETVTLGDTNRRWEVTLTNGGAPFRLPPNWTAALTGIKPDGTGLLNGCSVADGKIIYDFAAGEEIATCAGNYPVQFDIWDEVGDLVASPKIYVNVLADVRPHAELDSEGQYTLIGDLIGRVNQTDADVDLLGETALAQGDDIAALKEKVTTAGSVTIPASEWTDTLPKLAFPEQPVLAKGTVALLMPGNTDSQNAARKAKITVQAETYGGGKIVIQREDGDAPTGNITLDYIVIKLDNPEAPPKAALIGVDAYGNPPPYPVTSVNRKTGAVNLNASDVGARPSTWMPSAAEVGAEKIGTAETKLSEHNTDNDAHEYIQQRIDELEGLLEKFLDVDDETYDQLSELLRDIKSNASALELLGTGKIDKSSISTNPIDSNPDHVASMSLIIAINQAIAEAQSAISDLESGKQTAGQVALAIENALKIYLKTADADTKYVAKVAGKGLSTNDYTNDDKDKVAAALTQHQSLAHLLPKDQGKANAGKFMAVGEDGQVIYIVAPASDIIGNFTEDGGIELYKDLPVGTYTLYAVDSDGNRVKYATMTVTEASVSSYTNILTSGDATVNPNQRWSGSSNGLTDCDGMICVQIPVSAVSGKTLYFKGFTKGLKANSQGAVWMAVNSDNTLNGRLLQSTDGNVWTCAALVYDDATTAGSLKIDSSTFAGIASASKLCLNIAVYESAEITTLPDTLIMTIDEPI